MGTTLTGTTPQDTYDSLIKVTDNGPLSGTAKYLSDGLGNDSVLALSTSRVGIGTTSLQAQLHIDGTSAESSFIMERDTVGANAVIGQIKFTNNNGTTTYGTLLGGRNAAGDGYSALGTGVGTNLYAVEGGNVGIGTSSPASRLVVVSDDPSQVSVEASTGNVNSQINLKPSGTGIAYIKNQANTDFAFGTNNTEHMRITSTGVLSLTQGQIKFPATQVASSDPNTLDDYEEGTWTPRVFDDATGGNEATYTQNEGVYTKIGNMVYWRISISLASKGSMTAGNALYVRSFPFTSATVPSNWFNPTTALTWGATFADYLVFHQQGGTTFGYLYEVTSGGNGSALLVSDYTATAVINASGFYRV